MLNAKLFLNEALGARIWLSELRERESTGKITGNFSLLNKAGEEADSKVEALASSQEIIALLKAAFEELSRNKEAVKHFDLNLSGFSGRSESWFAK